MSVGNDTGLGAVQFDVGAVGAPLSPAETQLYAQLDRARQRMLEAISWEDNYIDPLDAYRDEHDVLWLPIGVTDDRGRATCITDELGLTTVRDQMRKLLEDNEFAINAQENRISYIVGSGHKYTAVAKDDDAEVPEEKIAAVQGVIDDFCKENQWHKRQQEIVRRKDRDGECFLRFFPDLQGKLRVRFVEPSQVKTPADRQGKSNETFGIVTEPDDVETIQVYWIDDRRVEAHDIQHRKANVDTNVKRGLSLFYPIRHNLSRAANLLLCMAEVAKVQAAIAMIRKHTGATGAGITQTLAADADVSIHSTTTGKTKDLRHYAPGTILDVPKAVDYEFPIAGIQAATFVAIVQAELRAAASRLCMPEFMLTSDASNANYSSTMVAEGPAVKIFQRLQWDMIVEDLEVLDRVLQEARDAGTIAEDLLEKIEITAEPPRVETKNEKEWAEVSGILVDKKIMSKHTGRLRHELDPDFEEEKIEEEREAADPFAGMENPLFAGQKPGGQVPDAVPPEE